ncbi:hypothetical protein JYK14_08550 [Siccirubricoccus sp. KC 17139]|uniref:Uncharacterized protein n=1 Tax=Siccirubricoccus soli TaxID=2899147 RepID=A0ABT1D2T9_9PROT|nr:hypothetical protein [Siccirubricoccus soli]MCO6416217.1 hypothetical protein [Siccirubricoccus soli]MCP2682351.1 hypothetical protein [Siccirubricoccus soli]
MHLGVGHRPEAPVRVVVGRGGIGQEHHPVVAEHRIPARGVAAILRRGARDDHRLGAPFPQDDVEVGADEAAVAALLDDMLVRLRREVRVDLDARRVGHQRGAAGDRRVHLGQPRVAAVAPVPMGRTDDPDAAVAADPQRLASRGTMARAAGVSMGAPSATKSFCMSTTIIAAILGSIVSICMAARQCRPLGLREP